MTTTELSFFSRAATLGLAALVVAGCGGSVTPVAGDDPDAGNAADSASGGDARPGDGAPSTDTGTRPDGVPPGDTNLPGDAPVAAGADEACTALADAYCGKLTECAKILVDVLWNDGVLCRARTKAACLTTLGSPGVAETPTMTGACAKDIAPKTCVSLLSKDDTPSCDPAPGAVDDGKACGDDEQCKSGFCAFEGGTWCGTCSPEPTAGSACTRGLCGRHLSCTAALKCEKPGKLGDSCDPKSKPCTTGLSCFGGACVPGGSSGDACDPNEIANPNCDGTKGLFCNPPSKQCEAIGEAAAGAACGYDTTTGIFTVCTAGATCRTSGSGFSGKCVAPAADGATCNPDPKIGPGCLSPAKCVAGLCKLSDPGACK